MQAESILQHHSSVFSIATEQILKQLESGVAPRHRPWIAQIHKNPVSGRGYRGINVFLLSTSGQGSPYWLTYKQATERGGRIRKGGHITRVFFRNTGTREVEDTEGEAHATSSILPRYYTVFSVEQFEGIASPRIAPSIGAIEERK
jgi:antirestriction protein ArdC